MEMLENSKPKVEELVWVKYKGAFWPARIVSTTSPPPTAPFPPHAKPKTLSGFSESPENHILYRCS